MQAVDGEDVAGLRRAITAAREETARPSLVITHTVIGRGSPNRAGKSKAHGEALGAEEVRLTKQAAGWPLTPEFLIPDDVRAYLAERSREKHAARLAADARLAAWRKANPTQAEAWDAARERRLPADLATTLCAGLDGKADATRKHGAVVLERLVAVAPWFVGGSADLAGSAAPPMLKGRGTVGPGAAAGEDPFAGSNLHFGVREHAMGAITNGIALDATFRPYCGTFLIFSDYMRPSLRLAALMRVPSFSSSPTTRSSSERTAHAPADRATRRAARDPESLRLATRRRARDRDGLGLDRAPERRALRCSRSRARPLPALSARRRSSPTTCCAAPTACGSRAHARVWCSSLRAPRSALACDAAGKLRAEGTAARVVSMPCVSRFLAQPLAYQLQLIPDDDTLIVAIEAGRGESLRRFVGRRGLVCGIDRFGASAPVAALAESFGFTPDAIAGRVRQRLAGAAS